LAGGWRRLHNEKFHTLFALPNIIRVIKSGGGVRWTGYVARVGEVNAYKICLESWKGRDQLEDLGIDGRIVLDWILEK